MRFLFANIFFAFVFYQSAGGQNQAAQAVFELIYNQDYHKAEELLRDQKDSIGPLYSAVLEIDLSYWKNVTGTDDPDYKAFENTLDAYDSKPSETESETVTELIIMSYRLRYQLKRYQLLRAISTRRKTVELFDGFKSQSNKLDGDQLQLFKLYNALIVYFDNYLKPFFAGDKRSEMNEAIAEMEQLTRSNHIIIRTLSSYFAGKVFLNYEKQPQKAAMHFEWLKARYPENKKFSELLIECSDMHEN